VFRDEERLFLPKNVGESRKPEISKRVRKGGPDSLDELDFKIFKSVGYRPFGRTAGDLSRLNPWVIARKVGADGNTVKSRISKMKKNGFIMYFQIYPNYQLLGITGSAYLFQLDDVLEKQEIIEKCSLVDGVVQIHNFIGPNIYIDFTHQDSRDERRRLDLFCKLTRCDSPEKFYERVMPQMDVESVAGVDWQIIKALRYDAFKPLSKVAEELGLTLKTVRNRFEKMARNNAIIIAPVVNPAEIVDTITYVLLIYPSPDKREEVMEKAMKQFSNSCFLVDSSSQGNSMLCLAARTLAETEDSLIKARKIEGMMNVKLLVLKEMREYTQWMDSAIDKKIAESVRQEPQDQKVATTETVPIR
jgi:DNA-binding Lrp family transcriptional regulator